MGLPVWKGGSSAGSALQLKDAVKNVVQWGVATPEKAIYMASTAPAIVFN
ncbi:hypothetical protein [Peribacillus simplex]|nr:hypothetical protein [Peribacillus simplex]